MAKTCQKCGNENLDFKVFCGFCGAELQDRSQGGGAESEVKVPQDHTSPAPLYSSSTYSLGGSKIVGIMTFFTPLALTLLTIPILWQLIVAEMASIGLMYGIALLVIIEAIICIGMVVQGGDWRLGNIDGAVRVLLVLSLFFSIAPLTILCLTVSIGVFPIEFAWLIALGILISIIWLFFFGWFRGIGYKWEKMA
jgi:hypothetical protein